MLGEKEAQKLCQRILSRCENQPAEVLLFSEDSALTRFANNTIHQNVSERNINLIVRYLIGRRKGTAETNRIDDAGLDDLVARARTNAQASAEDPNILDLPEPASYAEVMAFDPGTAGYTPEKRAQQVSGVCRLAREKGLNASGAFSTGSDEVTISNTNGLFAYTHTTSADFQTVVMTDDSSGRAHTSGWRVEDIPVEALGREAIEKAERGRNPRKIEPGDYTVVLDPYVTEDLVSMLNFNGAGAQAVLEGRSWMNDRIGAQAMDVKISIWDDGLNPEGLPMPFDFEGLPKQRVEIIKNGVVMGPVYDRVTAQKAGKESTGHAMPPTFRMFGPMATNLFMAAGDSDLDEMISATQKGLYITRFWYTRLVHPRDCVVTGMTRDGVFMIEDGQLAYPVKNMRFTQSYVDALAQVDAVGRKSRLLGSEFGGMAMRVPPLKLQRFNFTGSTV
jgi:PmbA protein